MNLKDHTGRKFARLTALEHIPGSKPTAWRCRCDCGKLVNVSASNLSSGNSRSCGCLVPDVAKGWVRTPEYTAFCNAKNRCNREGDIRFAQYGGRGIQFCFSDMAEFIACVGCRPSPDYSLDRINPNGHYEAGNIRWAPKSVQARNKQNSLFFEIDGNSKALKDWCEEFGQPYKRVWERVRSGWNPAKALTTPPGPTSVRYLPSPNDQTTVFVEGEE